MSNQNRSDIYVKVSNLLAEVGDLPGAQKYAGLAVLIDPDNINAYSALCDIYTIQGAMIAAEAYKEIFISVAGATNQPKTSCLLNTTSIKPQLINNRSATEHGSYSHPSEQLILTACGDLCLARELPGWVVTKGLGWSLGDISQIFKTSDVVFANLECVTSTEGDFINKGGYRPYYFRCHPEMLNLLLDSGINFVNLANNHSMDYGYSALHQETMALNACGIGHCGAGEDKTQALMPAFISCRGIVLGFIGVDTETNYAAATVDCGGINYIPENKLIRIMAGAIAIARSKADIVIITPHWGKNWEEQPNSRRISIARKLIDLGADLIIGHSSHLIQGIEIYRGKYIIYDMGTILFDRVNENRMKYSAIYTIKISQSGVTDLVITPVKLSRAKASIASDPDSKYIVDLLINLSLQLSQEVDPIEEDGCLSFKLNGGHNDLDSKTKKINLHPVNKSILRKVPTSFADLVANVVCTDVPNECMWAEPLKLDESLMVIGARELPRIKPGFGFLSEVFFRSTIRQKGKWEARLTAWNLNNEKIFEVLNPVAGGVWPQNRWRFEDIISDRIVIRPPTTLTEGYYQLTWSLVNREADHEVLISCKNYRIYNNSVCIGILHVDNKAASGVGGIV